MSEGIQQTGERVTRFVAERTTGRGCDNDVES